MNINIQKNTQHYFDLIRDVNLALEKKNNIKTNAYKALNILTKEKVGYLFGSQAKEHTIRNWITHITDETNQLIAISGMFARFSESPIYTLSHEDYMLIYGKAEETEYRKALDVIESVLRLT